MLNFVFLTYIFISNAYSSLITRALPYAAGYAAAAPLGYAAGLAHPAAAGLAHPAAAGLAHPAAAGLAHPAAVATPVLAKAAPVIPDVVATQYQTGNIDNIFESFTF